MKILKNNPLVKILLSILGTLLLIYWLSKLLIKPKPKQGQKDLLDKEVDDSINSPTSGQTLTRGFKNNNPGNIKYNVANAWLGKVPLVHNTDKEFEQFSELRYGVRAMIYLLRKKIAKYGKLYDVIADYAREDDKKHLAYADFVASATGWERYQLLTADRKTLMLLTIAMIRYENANQAISKDDFDSAYAIL